MMGQRTQFKDALDYIFIANDSGPNAYLISSRDIAVNKNIHNISNSISNNNNNNNNRMTNNAISASAGATATAAATVTAAAAATVAMLGHDMGSGGTANTDLSVIALPADNLYSSVAVGLGSMLINDTLLFDVNGTNLYAEIVNGSDLMANTTGNATSSDDDIAELVQMAVTTVVLGLMILITIIGNVFVIAAIILERNLQNVANYLVASLAVADLFVACLVMPLGAVYEISQGWILGPELCDIWTSCDVLCCTASILHLVAIAVDRYWAVTNIDYIHSRTSRRVFLMIFFVWTAAVIVSLAPQFGWKDPDYLQRIEQQKCMVSQDVGYQVFATCSTFYVPLFVILVLYWKIYQTARKRIHRRRPRPIDVTANNNQPDLSAQKKRKRLRLRIGKFSAEKGRTGAVNTLGLVEGNSTNTVNTVEDTEFSSSNVDSKSRAGIEVTTTILSNPEEMPTTSTSQISTVSHLVALANQQHATTSSTITSQQHQNQKKCATATDATATTNDEEIIATATTATKITAAEIKPTTTTTTAAITTASTAATKVCIVIPHESNGCTHSNGHTTSNGGAEVLEDPQLQQQLQQVHQQTVSEAVAATAAKNAGAGGGAASTSNATTITSISAISPQTPIATAAAVTSSLVPSSTSGTSQTHPLCSSANASSQVTPLPKPKHQQQLSSIANPMHKVTKRKETLEAKRERKAAKTLAIITGAFVVCWLPFFVMAILMPLCEACEINDGIAALFLWLGYFNSTLNPVIYTIFSPEFRQAFKRILFGGHRPVHYRSGKI